ncbi:hypothetical protein SFC43_05960 [Bacteroides sp. CR5/BHMF/2]|nr:hypothetical protein [Bacteroides sp. CR5/BHMF/2]
MVAIRYGSPIRMKMSRVPVGKMKTLRYVCGGEWLLSLYGFGRTSGAGPIKFRFMLGKDVKTDYNAERNTHYKLTLKFKGYGNDADWHIEYKEPPGIHVTTPQYISYLYNKDMMTTVKVVGEMKEGYKLVAKILAKNTKSYGADRPSSGEDDEVDPDFTGWKPWEMEQLHFLGLLTVLLYG